jgi:hypothetical protein
MLSTQTTGKRNKSKICVFCRGEDPIPKIKKDSKKKSQAPPARRLSRMQCESSCKFREGSVALSQPANKARGELETLPLSQK